MKKSRSIFQVFVTLVTIVVLLGGSGFQPAAAQSAGPQASVIVQASSAEQAAALVTQAGGTVTSHLEIIASVGATLPAAALETLSRQPGVVRVSPNAGAQLTEHSFDPKQSRDPVTDYPDVSGADLTWKAKDLGSGVTVAVIDTGVALHPALMKDVKGKPRMPVIGWVDFVEGKKIPTDPNGHGTHIAGIIANADKGADGEWNGMAPAARLVGIRVLDKTGAGDYEKVIQGIQWAVQHKDEYNIKVINLSLHSLVQSPYWADPMDQAVMRAWAAGITVVVAAGNDGPNPMSISVPGNTPYVITVGAYTDNYTPLNWNDDYLASFSAAGPTLDGFVKPDLLAPGAHITSTMLPGSYIARSHDANWVGGLYFAMAGTSQSAAVVSGAAALVIAQNPDLTPDQVKHRLLETALPWVQPDQSDVLYSVWQQGAGRLNVLDAAMDPNIEGAANQGMDILADLDGTQHYEGYSYFDETTGTFRIYGLETTDGGYGSWAGKYGSWAGKYGSWAGKYGSWAGKYGSWAGKYGSWAGKYGSWAGGYGSWAGGYGSWAGGYGSWAGGYGSWAGKYGSWAGSYGAEAGLLTDPAFIAHFIHGVSPNINSASASIHWVEDK